MRTLRLGLAAAICAVFTLGLTATGEAQSEPIPEDSLWYSVENGQVEVDLYFFWSSTCPHCQAAQPFVADLLERNDWIRLHSFAVDDPVPGAQEVFDALVADTDLRPDGVPAFYLCEDLVTGFNDERGVYLEERLQACRTAVAAGLSAPGTDLVEVPVLGDVDAETVWLPGLTVMIAGLDAFNPCAFFVLFFLLSLLVNVAGRGRMLFIGGLFVFVSGLMYFAFMAAWLNVYEVFGAFGVVTTVAGMVAITIALFNIKDFFWYGRGVSFSIPESAKPGLFKRMRGLTAASGFGALSVGTATLAVAANTYELVCTLGFPLVYTRILTLNDLSTPTYYGYLVLYNVVYITPLLVIVGAFVAIGQRYKLTAYQGRVLKLASGSMMLALGLVLVFAPDLLNEVKTSAQLLGSALAATALIVVSDRWWGRRPAHR